VLRARIILADVGGKQPTVVWRAVGVTRETSRLWRARQEARLAAEVEGGEAAVEVVIGDILGDESRSGRPATFSPEQVCQILALACEPPEALGRPMAHWTPRELADEAVHRGIVPRISPASVGRFLKGGRAHAAPQSLLADTSS